MECPLIGCSPPRPSHRRCRVAGQHSGQPRGSRAHLSGPGLVQRTAGALRPGADTWTGDVSPCGEEHHRSQNESSDSRGRATKQQPGGVAGDGVECGVGPLLHPCSLDRLLQGERSLVAGRLRPSSDYAGESVYWSDTSARSGVRIHGGRFNVP
jgi:hypothetical protein